MQEIRLKSKSYNAVSRSLSFARNGYLALSPTPAGGRRGLSRWSTTSVTSCLCVCVCVCVRAVKEKLHSVLTQSTAGPRHALDLEIKNSKVKITTVTERRMHVWQHCGCGSKVTDPCRRWIMYVNELRVARRNAPNHCVHFIVYYYTVAQFRASQSRKRQSAWALKCPTNLISLSYVRLNRCCSFRVACSMAELFSF